MNFLSTEIGSAKENASSPIHNWYKFTAGFSYRFVNEIISLEKLDKKPASQIFDPFAGCGTTLVSSQKLNIPAVGNEGQKFMFDVIRAKLNWKIVEKDIISHLNNIRNLLKSEQNKHEIESQSHKLLSTLYTTETLSKLYLIKNYILSISSTNLKLFFKLALSQTLHKVAIHPIAVPYISRNKTLNNTDKAWEFFENISIQMYKDTTTYNKHKKTSKIFLQDSRYQNKSIDDNSCNLCITSPPYLNNLDYGEVSKVHTHFFDITNNWNDITNQVRKKLVTGATTHFKISDYIEDEYKKTDFYLHNSDLCKDLLQIASEIKKNSKGRGGKKSFDILTLFYFRDMYLVLKEIRRIMKEGSTSYLILGDSAPYGVYVPTTDIIGKISLSVGFKQYKIEKIRQRGEKWKTLRFRHSLKLTENVLMIK